MEIVDRSAKVFVSGRDRHHFGIKRNLLYYYSTGLWGMASIQLHIEQ